MQCIGGPLDGFECDPSVIRKGVATLGLVRKVWSCSPCIDRVPYWDAEEATYKQSQHVEYREQNGRLIYSGMRS
jgi:hypothetical protein